MLFLSGLIDLVRRFLTCCNIAFVPMVAVLVASVFHLFWLWLFIIEFELGIVGVPLSMLITEITQLTIIFLYTRCLPELQEAFFLPTRDAFSGWSQYLKLSLPGILVLCGEWWAFEILIILAGLVGVKEQAVMVLLCNLTTLMFMVPLGFGEGAATVVGNAMGEKMPELAKRYLIVACYIAVPFCYACAGIVYFMRSAIAGIYIDKTSAPELHALMV